MGSAMSEPEAKPVIPEDSAMVDQRFARNLDWNLLRTFHEICRAKGISGAARATSRKQPALSMALRRLEELVGARLCERGPSGFCLTREGETLLKACENILDTVTAIPANLADITSEVRGRVRVQMISNLIDRKIDTAISNLHDMHPEVEVVVSISTWEVVPRSVLRNEADVGIAPAHVRLPSLRYETLFKEIYLPYCGRHHPLYGRHLNDPRDLAGTGLIFTGADEPEQLTRFRLKYGIGRRVAGLAERLEEARRLTSLGVGVCFLPQGYVAEDVETGMLHPVLELESPPASEICVISSPHAPPHPARAILLDLLRAAT